MVRRALPLTLLLLARPVFADKPEIVELNAVGDVAWPNGWGGIDEVDSKQDGLFVLVKPVLDQADLNFANVECPLTAVAPKVKKTYPIACEPKRLEYVVKAGFNLFSLANNHALDAGEEGAADTLKLFADASTQERPLFFAGTGPTENEANRAVFFTVPGKKTKVAFFAVAMGGLGAQVGSLSSPTLNDRIAEASKRADVVIVSVHNGLEYTHVPAADIVKRYHELVDAGATVVLGHHPHVVQGVERYGDGVIFYSLGNFSFGSHTVRHHETGARMYSMIGRVRLVDGKIDAVRVVPLYANNTETWTIGAETLQPLHACPQLLKGVFAAAALEEFQDFSAAVPGATPTKLLLDGDVADVEPSDSKIAVKDPSRVVLKRPPTAAKAAPKKKRPRR